MYFIFLINGGAPKRCVPGENFPFFPLPPFRRAWMNVLDCRWLNCALPPRNCRDALSGICLTSTAEYKQVRDAEKRARLMRVNQWPEYSTYTATMLLDEKLKAEDRHEWVIPCLHDEANVKQTN